MWCALVKNQSKVFGYQVVWHTDTTLLDDRYCWLFHDKVCCTVGTYVAVVYWWMRCVGNKGTTEQEDGNQLCWRSDLPAAAANPTKVTFPFSMTQHIRWTIKEETALTNWPSLLNEGTMWCWYLFRSANTSKSAQEDSPLISDPLCVTNINTDRIIWRRQPNNSRLNLSSSCIE